MADAGLETQEVRINHLAYSDEIASAMSLTSFAGSLFSTFVSNPVASQVIPRIGTANTMILYGVLAAFAGVCFALYLRYTEGNKVQNI